MKKLLLSLMCLWFSIGTFAQFSGSGSGTKDDPYLIFNPIQLNQVRGFLNKTGVYFKMMSDVDLTEWIANENPTQGWQPIGTSDSPFKGVFDGNGHTISGFMINRPSSDYIGLFANIDGSKINNLEIKGSIYGNEKVGGFVGYASNSTFENCSFVGTINSSSYVGGILGYIPNGTNADFYGCSVDVNIESTGTYVGGIFGRGVYEGRFESGIMINMENCTSKGFIKGKEFVGGIGGRIHQHVVKHCVSFANIMAETSAGGLFGYTHHADGASIRQISECAVICNVQCSGEDAGGLIGHDEGDYWLSLDINNCYFSGNVIGDSHVGGIIGFASASNISNCFVLGDIRGKKYVGGIVGWMNAGEAIGSRREAFIRSSVCLADVIECEESECGRIVGYKQGRTYIDDIESSTGNIALSTTQVLLKGNPISVEDNLYNGRSVPKDKLMKQTTYNYIGWNFTDIWNIEEGKGFPYLRKLPIDENHGDCGENVKWYFDSESATLKITGNGSITFESLISPWYSLRSKIVSLVIEQGITAIPKKAFEGFSSLKKVTIPNSVTSIGEQAFKYCSSLTSIKVSWKRPLSVPADVFDEVDKAKCTLYVPKGTEMLYWVAPVWSEFPNIQEFSGGEDDTYYITIKYADCGAIKQEVELNKSYNYQFEPTTGWELNTVSFNGTDVTTQITENKYTTPQITGNSELIVVFKQSSAINDMKLDSNVKVFASSRAISITGATAKSNVSIYSTDGKLLKSAHGNARFTMDNTGVYIVKVDNEVFKVSL